MAFFDFLKGKKKEEANQTEIKSENGTIELEGIEVELPKTEENEMKLELSKKDKPEAVNAAVHKAMTSEDVELYTATGGKLYEEKTDINPSHSQKEPFPQIDVPQQSDIKPKTASEQAPQPENCENNEQRDLQNESLPCQQNMDVECDQPSEDLQTEQEPKKKGFFAKLIAGLDKTRKNILGGADTVLGAFTKIDEDLFEELEEVLIMADLGVETTMNIIDNLRKRVKKEHITDPQAIRGMLIEEITAILEEGAEEEEKQPSGPTVMLVIGVNGVGKTTTIGKLSCHFKEQGKTVLLGAADTFRAAAIEQLEIWGQRAGIDVVKHQQNSDPAAVVFDAVNAAKSRKIDLLICDTAGRLHNKKNLMEELKKIAKVIDREYPQAHKEVYLVLDATTGQNAMQQAKLFKEAADITGIILTKLDGTAKGGIVIAIQSELKVPVRYIGVGEGIYDLQKFDAKVFAKALFGE